jgi:hypothetical protein
MNGTGGIDPTISQGYVPPVPPPTGATPPVTTASPPLETPDPTTEADTGKAIPVIVQRKQGRGGALSKAEDELAAEVNRSTGVAPTHIRQANLIVTPARDVPLAKIELRLPAGVRLSGNDSARAVVWTGYAHRGRPIKVSLNLQISGTSPDPLEVVLQTRNGKVLESKRLQLNTPAPKTTATADTAPKPAPTR